jgi:hypothetical protein
MRLLDRPNFILTPHVAWASREAIQGLADQLTETSSSSGTVIHAIWLSPEPDIMDVLVSDERHFAMQQR